MITVRIFRRLVSICCLTVAMYPAALCGSQTTPVDRNCLNNVVITPPAATPNSNPAGPTPHSVKLSWQASVPANAAPQSAVAGYNIYRRESGNPCEQPRASCVKINKVLITGTACVDYDVSSGHTYIYEAQAVSVAHVPSRMSKQAKARVP